MEKQEKSTDLIFPAITDNGNGNKGLWEDKPILMNSIQRTLDPIKLARESGLPLYLQIAHELMYRLEMGIIRTGDNLPSMRHLATDLDVSLLTVDKAYKWLRNRGVVTSHQGVGWKVTLATDSSGAETRQRVRIGKFVDEMLNAAVQQGFDPMVIAQNALHRATVMERQIPVRKLVFVECHQDYLDDYTAELRRELDDLHVEIHGVLTESLGKNISDSTPAGKILREAEYVMSTLYHFEFVQRTMAALKQRVVALSHTIDRDALYKIVSLQQKSRLGVVFGPMDPAPGIVRTLEFYRDVPTGSIPFAIINDLKAVRKLVAKSDVIVYTAACKDQIGAVVNEPESSILMRFVPDDDAIGKIRTLLGMTPGPKPAT